MVIDETNPKDAIGDRKPPLWLVPAAATIVESEVFRLGAAKYGPYNWRQKKVRATVYVAALLRHVYSYLDGEDLDPESGQSHVAHARACTAILLDAAETGNLIDDRPPPGAAGPLIARLTVKDQPQPSETTAWVPAHLVGCVGGAGGPSLDIGVGFRPMLVASREDRVNADAETI